MARLPRIVIPGFPHHVTQRGNRRQPTFFCDLDYLEYVGLMQQACDRHGVEIWAWCLMPNHSHLAAVPSSEEALSRAISEAHQRYTRDVNARMGWTGHLWQGRYASFVMDERYLLATARYIELNPVRAGLVERPQDYPWSSARAHLAGRDDDLVKVAPLLDRIGDWASFLGTEPAGEMMVDIRKHLSTGRPLGDDRFIGQLEARLGRPLRPQQRGPHPHLHDPSAGPIVGEGVPETVQMMSTVQERGPWAPITRACSMSAVFDGPERNMANPRRGSSMRW